MRFTWMSNSAPGSTAMWVRSRMRRASASLFRRFTRRHCSRKPASVSRASRPLRSERLATQPSPTVSLSSFASGGLLSIMKRRGVTPLVMLWNRSGHSSAKSFSTVCCSSCVCRAATPLTAWLPTVARFAMRTRFSPVVAGVTLPYLIEEAPIDLENYLQRPRQQLAEQRQPPGFERFGQQGMVGVRQGAAGDIPGLLPRQRAFIHQQPHELRYRDCRMRVVHLHRKHVRQGGQGCPFEVQQAQHVLQRAGDEKVLLSEAQTLAGLRLIIRIEHL